MFKSNLHFQQWTWTSQTHFLRGKRRTIEAKMPLLAYTWWKKTPYYNNSEQKEQVRYSFFRLDKTETGEEMRLAGVDDAGRGPVLGPLVIAGILINSDDLPHLINLKVKDSKLLLPKRREQLYGEIIKIVDDWQVVSCCQQRLIKLSRLV